MDEAVIVNRPVEFEENGNYVIVGVRHAGKSYLLYQRVRQLQAAGKGWDEILFVDFEDERLAEFQTEDFNSLLEAYLELYGKKPVVFLDEVQNIPHWDKFVRRLADAKYRVYATGSNAKMLSKEVATTLGGSLAVEIERVAKDADEEFDDIARELIDIRTELSKPQSNSSFLKKSFKALTWGAAVSCKTTIEELVKNAIEYLSQKR